MQDIYQNDWCEQFRWSEQHSFMTWPEHSAAALFNSDSLRSAGRSPAVDFWKERGQRLCGQTNYLHIHIRTDGEKTSVDPFGLTTFLGSTLRKAGWHHACRCCHKQRFPACMCESHRERRKRPRIMAHKEQHHQTRGNEKRFEHQCAENKLWFPLCCDGWAPTQFFMATATP